MVFYPVHSVLLVFADLPNWKFSKYLASAILKVFSLNSFPVFQGLKSFVAWFLVSKSHYLIYVVRVFGSLVVFDGRINLVPVILF